MNPRHARLMPRSVRPSLRSFAFSVTVATVGVGVMYQFLLPQLTHAVGGSNQEAPALTRMAIAAGTWWLMAALAGGLLAAWLMRPSAADWQQRMARAVLRLILLLDVVMVGVSLAGFYASIAALPQGFG